MKECVKKCLGEIIVSCQAYEDTPMYGEDSIVRFVRSAQMGGARAVRVCWPENIKAAREVSEDLVIIGIDKTGRTEGGQEHVFITPDFESARRVIEAGADIVALDARILEERGAKALQDLIVQIHEAYPHIGIMADCATLEDARAVLETGCADIISTTLSNLDGHVQGVDTELVKEMKAISDIPVNGEGSVWELKDVDLLLDAGADMITIGSAITRPHLIARRFLSHNKEHLEQIQSESKR